MLNEVNKGIINLLKANNNAFITALSGRLFYDEAPNDTTPYCVFSYNEIPSQDSEDEYLTIDLQFSFYDSNSSVERLGNIIKECKKIFNDCESRLVIDGWAVISVIQTRAVNLGKVNRAEHDVATYIVELQKQ